MNDVEMLLQYLIQGDLLGLVIALYVLRIGQLFFALVTFGFSGVIYLRTESVLVPAVMWLVLGGAFISLMPIVSPIAVLFVTLGISALMYKLFSEVR